jgi:hypothetical protein
MEGCSPTSATFNRPPQGTGTYTATRNPRPIKTVNLILDTGGAALTSASTSVYDTTYEFSVGLDRTSTTEYAYTTVDQRGVLIEYRLRNVSNKPIEFVSVMIRHSSGTGGNSMPMPRVKKVLLPNETLEAASEPIDYEIVGVYKSDQKPSSREEMKTLCILLVDKVLFTDGSVYEDPETLDALDRFLKDFCNR